MLYLLFIEYIKSIRDLLFAVPKVEMSQIVEKYRKSAPKPLVEKFDNRVSKQEAVAKYKQRKETHVSLYPPGKHYHLSFHFCLL